MLQFHKMQHDSQNRLTWLVKCFGYFDEGSLFFSDIGLGLNLNV